MKLIKSSWFPLLLGLIIVIVILNEVLFTPAVEHDEISIPPKTFSTDDWQAPDINELADDEKGQSIRYGRELIINTSLFFGPKGKISPVTNGMNCQNCHIDAGAKSFGGSFSAVASTYPRYRERSGRIESIEFRINDCMLRSLNGKMIDSAGKEMQSMVAYLKWIGKNVPKNKKPAGAGLEELSFLKRAADPEKGRKIFLSKCVSCHGEDGQGLLNHDSSFYLYPPLWGTNSFNVSAGLYRITRLASFVKNNMPLGLASHSAPQLSDEDAWDVAAFIISQPRPEKFFAEDWPGIEKKPVDYPYGPYADNFSEKQHKYGPFLPIQNAKNKK
ncbi:MAG TPA: c-type cytochrome [Chitinophagaceae bacterium]|nr:c-type cytochrome [Chitinophagaceae bacterium]